MSLFYVLILLNAALCLAAVIRARPGALMIALNQVGTLRALENIRVYGQPRSEAFLPNSLFTPQNLDIAAAIFGISTLLLLLSLVIPGRPPPARVPNFPRLPNWAMVGIGLYLVGATISTGSLLSEAYTNEAGTVLGLNLGGLNALMLSLCLYEVARRSITGIWQARWAFATIAAILFLTNFSKGSTGLATGYGIGAAIMLWPSDGRTRLRRVALTLALVAGVGLTAYVIRGIRHIFYERGFASVSRYLRSFGTQEDETSQTGEGIELGSNGTQYACHCLECIHLYEIGISRDWRSVYDPVVYTFEPSFLLRPLGVTRPKEAAWELADYYLHGGGIYLLGELYWNGGYFCVIAVFGLVLLLTFYCDTRYRQSPGWLMMCSQFAPGLLMGVGYGFAQVIRGAFNGLLVLLVYRMLPLLNFDRLSGLKSRTPVRSPRPLDGRPPARPLPERH